MVGVPMMFLPYVTGKGKRSLILSSSMPWYKRLKASLPEMSLAAVFSGETSTSQLKRGLAEIAGWVTAEMDFPLGVFVMTGTCLVPEDEFTLLPGDQVRVEVGNLALDNSVES